ncbi:cation efflux family-domain-containing protein [Phlyctochytrium arcticum]|nr:cation efflux family-domain-containing protein [Phlyctochytrium arcticum]
MSTTITGEQQAGSSSEYFAPPQPVHIPSASKDTITIDLELHYAESSHSESSYASASDPLLLRRGKKGKEEIQALRKSSKNGRKLSEFYERQNELIDDLLSPPGALIPNEEQNLLKLKIAVYGSLVANVFLFALQLVAAVLSKSLALFATTADAFMDLASSAVLVYTGRVALSQNLVQYPTGKTRMETAGIIVFASLMATLSVQLMVEGVRTLIDGEHAVDLSPLSIGLICGAIGIKVILYLYCRTVSQYPSAKVLAQDQRNDILMNGLGITLSILSTKIVWWLDPAGAIVIAVLILRSWAGTAGEHIQYLVGKTADPHFLQKVTYLSVTHDDRILQVDTCRAYHAGHNFFVEVDIVLPQEMTVMESHDIAEGLQTKLELLPNVERCFVHIDYETSHTPEHRKVK